MDALAEFDPWSNHGRGGLAAALLFSAGPLPTSSAAALDVEAAALPSGLTNLPWGVLHAGTVALAAVTTPTRAFWRMVADATDEVPVIKTLAEPTSVVIQLVDASLGLAVSGTDLAADVTATPLTGPQKVGDSAWQLPALPPVDAQLTDVATSLTAVDSAVARATECDCLPSALTERLDRAGPTLDESTRLLDRFSPALVKYRSLAGYDGKRTYLLVVGNQAEMRASGGAPLYLAVIEADNGLVRVTDKGVTSSHFFPPENAPVTWVGDPANPFLPANPRTMPFVNAGAHPDFATSAKELAAAFEAGGHPSLDGVVFVDLSALQSILQISGPIQVANADALDAGNVITRLLDDAYRGIDAKTEIEQKADNAQRQSANDALFQALLSRVSGGLPAHQLLNAVDLDLRGRHLQTWFRDASTQQAFDAAGWGGRVREPASGDWLAWYTQSGNPSKTDVHQRLTADRSVVIEPKTTAVKTTFTVGNDNPNTLVAGADPRRGYNATWMRTAVLIYVPAGATNVQVSHSAGMDAAPLGQAASADAAPQDDGLGNHFLRFVGWIEPQAEASITVSYTLPTPTGADAYRLTLEPQTGLNPYVATVTTSLAGAETKLLDAHPVTEQMVLTLPRS